MLTAAPPLAVRAIGDESFDDIYPLLQLFSNPKMSRDDWRRMLFTYPWWHGSERGFALYAGDVAVGFLGTIFSTREIDGRTQTFCNASSWIVREQYRTASVMLLRAMLAMRDVTILNLTPTARSYEIFEKLGFRALESEQIILPPLANPVALARTTVITEAERFVPMLTPTERGLHQMLRELPNVAHAVLARDGRTSYVIATRRRVKRVPIAEVHYIGDRELFWANRAAAHAAMLRVLGTPAIIMDRRFSDGAAVGPVVRRASRRLYRPSGPQIEPSRIDNLFSELLSLKI